MVVILPTHAATLFTDLGVGNSYSIVGGYQITSTQSVGLTFTSPAPARLDEIDVALSRALFSPTGDGLELTLNADSGGLPGTVLASWTLNNLPYSTACCALQTVTPTSPTFLTAGSLYWLMASTSDSTATFIWNLNLVGDTSTGPGLLPSAIASPFLLGAFQVTGTVPEPGSVYLSLAGLGLIIVGMLRPKSDC